MYIQHHEDTSENPHGKANYKVKLSFDLNK